MNIAVILFGVVENRMKLDQPKQYIVVNFNKYPFDTAKYAGGLVGSYPQKEHMSAEVYREYIDVPFEGKTHKGVKDYDTYLSVLYGDYMKLPPVEQQQGIILLKHIGWNKA